MYKKYTIPISIFVVYENINPIIWTSNSFGYNNYIVYINQVWFYCLNLFFKNEIFFYNSMLLENSAIDNKNNFDFLKKNQIFFKNKLMLFYVYYFFTLKSKIILLLPNNGIKKLTSIDKIYKSSSWLERETGEMFKLSFSNKIDTRRLLLDYSKQENPLLKDYPCEGFNDVFYSFFDDQVICNNSTSIEL